MNGSNNSRFFKLLLTPPEVLVLQRNPTAE